MEIQKKEFGKFLKEIRLIQPENNSMEAVSSKLNISQSHWSKMEQGILFPGPSTLEKIILGEGKEFLVGIEDIVAQILYGYGGLRMPLPLFQKIFKRTVEAEKRYNLHLKGIDTVLSFGSNIPLILRRKEYTEKMAVLQAISWGQDLTPEYRDRIVEARQKRQEFMQEQAEKKTLSWKIVLCESALRQPGFLSKMVMARQIATILDHLNKKSSIEIKMLPANPEEILSDINFIVLGSKYVQVRSVSPYNYYMVCRSQNVDEFDLYRNFFDRVWKMHALSEQATVEKLEDIKNELQKHQKK